MVFSPHHADADDIAPLADLSFVEAVDGFVFRNGARAVSEHRCDGMNDAELNSSCEPQHRIVTQRVVELWIQQRVVDFQLLYRQQDRY